jgi:hypothetical protein
MGSSHSSTQITITPSEAYDLIFAQTIGNIYPSAENSPVTLPPVTTTVALPTMTIVSPVPPIAPLAPLVEIVEVVEVVASSSIVVPGENGSTNNAAATSGPRHNNVGRVERRAISFGLYGSNPKYTLGALVNASQVAEVYPGWEAVFYVDPASVPTEIIEELRNRGARVILDSPYRETMFARFLIADHPDYDRFLVRDVDSRLSTREVAAVEDWIKSGLPMHNMRDHPWHGTWVMGGLWGGTRGFLKGQTTMLDLVQNWRRGHGQKGKDQEFLADRVLPIVGHKQMFSHDAFLRHKYPGSIPFPTPGPFGKDFVGQVYELNHENIFYPFYDIPR